MNKYIILLFILYLSVISYAHKYYFAFAEVEYNEMNQTLEATIIATSHDVEFVLKEQGVISKSLDYAQQNKKEYQAINDYLNKTFSVHTVDSLTILALDSSLPPRLEFILDGFEVLLNGYVQFYLSGKTTSPITQCYVKFDLLMDKFPDQQNKLTFRFREKKLTYNYLIFNKIQFIKLEQ
jgi:hypothetical protein